MRWVRANTRFGARLALLALALQLLLSFGHIHPEDFAFSSPSKVAMLSATALDGGPSSDRDERAGHDYCAICATISLASTLLLPEPVSLPILVAREYKWQPSYYVERLNFNLHIAFQARGPPLA